MQPQQPTQLLDVVRQTHQFPCAYTFKAIGHDTDGFTARVIAAVREQLGQEVDPPFTTRSTAGGKHIAVTVEPTVQTAEEVVAVYQRLQGVVGIVMLF